MIKTKKHFLNKMLHQVIDKSWHAWFLRLPRNAKRLIMILSDMIMLNVALWSAFALRFSEWWPEKHLSDSMGVILIHTNHRCSNIC